MNFENNIDKIITRQKEIENLLVDSSNLKQSELTDIKDISSDIIAERFIRDFKY